MFDRVHDLSPLIGFVQQQIVSLAVVGSFVNLKHVFRAQHLKITLLKDLPENIHRATCRSVVVHQQFEPLSDLLVCFDVFNAFWIGDFDGQ